MSLITATNLAKAFGNEDIFQDISLGIPRRARTAIVGANGIGKTTLLRILVGLDEPSAGEIHRSKGLRIGYLPQEATLLNDGTLWDQCLQAFSELIALSAELQQLEKEMIHPQTRDAALVRYGTRQTYFEHLGGYTYEATIRQTLTGLGFSESDYQRPVLQLSGGQRTRALLAQLLLEDPDLLLLDEPTNHLDIGAVEWLEAWLRDWDGAVVIVSHDRYFLDQVATTIWEMTPVIEKYRGNYSAYVLQREERYARRLAEYEAQAEFIDKEEDYIRRNIAGQNTSQAKGRQRRLSRLLEEAKLTPPRNASRKMAMNLQTALRSGDLVLRTYDLQVGYHDEGRPLFFCPDLVLQRGECTAIIGPNGAGKTTFLKTILEKIPPYKGEVRLGASLKVAYFAQAHEELKPERTLMEEINTVLPSMLPAEVRNYLARYLFMGDDVFRKVNTLSGGERGRLALAKLALSDANLLLLDEPTNHLDLPTQEVLQSILADYRGTIILVSHDRYLIDALASQIWEVDPQAETLHLFEGSYTQYKAERSAKATQNNSVKIEQVTSHPVTAKSNPKPVMSRNQERQIRSKMTVIEDQIKQLELELSRLALKLENPPDDPVKVQHLGKNYMETQSRIDKHLSEWDDLSHLLG
jgi:ATP-binding cassette subfamily F protein 3